MRVAFVITGLSRGGAETMLLKLLERIDKTRFGCRVFSLTGLGEIGPLIEDLGIPVEALNMRRGRIDPRGVVQLARRLRETQADLVHTWMYHADLLGGLAARLAGVRPVIWGLRNTHLDRDKTSRSTRMVARLNGLLSRWLPDGILSCSDAARVAHVARGYPVDRISVIPNGFDVTKFRPDPAARHSVRKELGLTADTPLVGLIGRYDPVKNHRGFIEAAGQIKLSCPEVHFVLAGWGVDASNRSLHEAATRAGTSAETHLLGPREDMPRIMAALDVLASSSFSEAFPNVLGEAMACSVPCVVTDVGDSASIVGDTGRIVPNGDMGALAAAIRELIALGGAERAALGERARARICAEFEIASVTRHYEDYYEQVCQSRP